MKNTRRFFIGLLAGYFLLLAFLVYWQLIIELDQHPLNPGRYSVFRSPRGEILDRNGQVLAETIDDAQGTRRVYATSGTSHITGYFHVRYGMSGLEQVWHERLASGQKVHTTIDLGLQQRVEDLLEGQVGAVVVMEPRTGQILALASYPYVDGNALSEKWPEYLTDQRSPFINRAVQGQYPPGSALKPLVLAAALESRAVSLEDRWNDRGVIELSGRRIANFQGQALGEINTKEALALSSNTVFAQLAAELGSDLLHALQRFGLGTAPNFCLPTGAGNLPGSELSAYGWGQVGIGQGPLLVTPLQMACAVSAIANGGTLMRPYLVQEIEGGWRFPKIQRPRVMSQVVPQWAAAGVRDAMVLAVRSGTAKSAQVPGILTAGKTGTAQTASGADHSWFIGFAPALDPAAAVVVLLEHGGTASQTAAPLGGLVLWEALKAQGILEGM